MDGAEVLPDGAGGVDGGGMDGMEVLPDGDDGGAWGGARGVDGGGVDGIEVLPDGDNGNEGKAGGGGKGGRKGCERTSEEGTLLMTAVIVVSDSTWLSSSAVESRI